MSNYVNNLNELINTKKELKDIIIESTGENPSEVFSYYPSYIRSAIAAGGGSASEEAVNSYISAYLSAYNYIDQDTLSSNSYLTSHQDLSSYATKSYVVDYVATYAPTPDLSSYVSKTELSACGYITINDVPSTDLSGYVSKTELSAQAYLTSIPSEYITDTELSSMGYITSSDIPASVIIDENLSPKEDNMYNIGSNSYRYNTVNTQRINNSNTLGGIKLSLNNTDYYSVLERAILPSTTSYSTLGNNSKQWYATYTEKLYINGVDADTKYAAPDLSGYVSKVDLSNQSYITMNDVSACGYITSIPSEYITQNELSSCGYITISDIPSSVVVDENLIPKESLTYTIGDASHLYNAAYTNNIKGNDSIKLSINNSDKYTFANGFFAPTSNDGQNLGHKDYKWFVTYISNIHSGTLFSLNNTNTRVSFTNLNTIRLYANNAIYNLEYNNFSPDNDKSKNLGTSSKSWLSTYTKNLYLNGTNIEDRFSALITQSDIDNMSYITISDVAQMGYITANDVDLSDYVSYDYADENYVSYSYLGDLEEITEYILGSGSGSAPENIYATKSELNSYVSKTSLESMSYITKSDVDEMGYITMDDIDTCGYITAADVPETDLSDYPTFDDISNMGYITMSDVPATPDLSSYVTKTELSNCGYITINDVPVPDLSSYVTKTELSNQSYLTSIPSEYITQQELSSNGYLTSVPNTYPTYTAISNMGYITTSVNNLSNYYTKTNINNASYVSKTQVNGMFSYDSSTGILTITTIS